MKTKLFLALCIVSNVGISFWHFDKLSLLNMFAAGLCCALLFLLILIEN